MLLLLDNSNMADSLKNSPVPIVREAYNKLALEKQGLFAMVINWSTINYL